MKTVCSYWPYLVRKCLSFLFPCFVLKYRIRPNYRTVRLGFSKLLGTLSCGKICIYLLRIHYKKIRKKTYLMMIMRFFFLIFFIKAYVVGTHLHRRVDEIQMSTHNIGLYKEVKKKHTGCNLRITEFLNCTLIGVCAVIRSNTVDVMSLNFHQRKYLIFTLHYLCLIIDVS